MAVPTTFALVRNASVSSTTRGRVAVWDAHRVTLTTPSSPMERMMPDGTLVDRVLYDGITATYGINDIVTLVAEDGAGTYQDPPLFSVAGVSPQPGRLPYVKVQLVATRLQGA